MLCRRRFILYFFNVTQSRRVEHFFFTDGMEKPGISLRYLQKFFVKFDIVVQSIRQLSLTRVGFDAPKYFL